ncbi:MAG: hypothetical protein Q4B77_06470 [Coriobacteriaceae bacterium]|nr:hypothetical protein [Coriobacteriaceae bacterium]
MDDEQASIRRRFAEAIFLIAAGVRKREELFCSDSHRYPYADELRSGIEKFVALHMQYAENDQIRYALTEGLSESSFIRSHCTQDLATWVEGWSPAAKEALSDDSNLRFGPLVDVYGNFFSVTNDCEQLLASNGNGDLADLHEFQAYTMLKAGGQNGYVFGRKFLITHPILTYDDLSLIRSGNLSSIDAESPAQIDESGIDPNWFYDLVKLAYESAPNDARICPACGWTMTRQRLQTMCMSVECAKGVDATSFERLPKLAPDSLRLRRGIMRFIAKPGKLELEIARNVQKTGLAFELWPAFDSCDILVTLPDGRTIAIDAKDHKNIDRLTRDIQKDTMKDALNAAMAIYVVPRSTPPKRLETANAALKNKPGHACTTLPQLNRLLKHEQENQHAGK